MPTRRELRLQKRIVIALNKRRQCLVAIRAQSVYTVVGDPDVTGSISGRHVEIEVKEPGEEPTAIQRERHRIWRRAGARVVVVESVKEALEFAHKVSIGK